MPGGGSVAAHAGALGAALAQMVAGLTIGKKKYAAVDAEMREIAVRAAALGNTLERTRRARRRGVRRRRRNLQAARRDAGAARRRRRRRSTRRCSPPPTSRWRPPRACADVAELALAVAERGNTNAASDAGVAALLAEAGCIGASYNVRINVVALSDRSLGAALELEARQLVVKAGELARRTSEAVERALVAQ